MQYLLRPMSPEFLFDKSFYEKIYNLFLS